MEWMSISASVLLYICAGITVKRSVTIPFNKQKCQNNGVILSERSEPKDLRTDLRAKVNQVRGFFDFAFAPLRMTNLLAGHIYHLADESR